MPVKDDSVLWQDRQLQFDILMSQLQPRPGEFQIDMINSVEDTKGNNGERGMLSITNMRLLWIHHQNPRINLSIGYSCIISLNIQPTKSKLRGETQAMFLTAKYETNRFEFIFTSLVNKSPRLFTSIQTVYSSYCSTRLYRDLKLRAAIIKDKQLQLLPKEEVSDVISGVLNLSNCQGSMGVLYVTNIRVVWHSNIVENFNVSIPYIQIKSIRVKESSVGNTLIINSIDPSNFYTFGFRIDPVEKLQQVFQEIKVMFDIYGKKPIFGIDFSIESSSENPSVPQVDASRGFKEDLEVVTDVGGDAIAAYYALGGKSAGSAEPEFNAQIGLAMEPLPESIQLSSLWNV